MKRVFDKIVKPGILSTCFETKLVLKVELVYNILGIWISDIKDGNLKAILGLFFSLSRFKQQQKTNQQKQPTEPPASVTLPQVNGDSNGGTGGKSMPHLGGGEMLSR